MKKLILAAGAAAICSAGAFAADIHTPVAITGCVHAGTEPGTYVLMNVYEVTDGHAVPAGAVYWLSSTKGLKDNVGNKVEVRGTYSLDRDYGKTAKLKVKTDNATGEQTVSLENGAKKTEIKEEVRPVGTSGVVASEVKRPYRRLEVASLRTVAESCVAP
jgi:opacity protein-like surface antigen